MIFVNPLLLAGISLVALPIVLHLVMRRKPRLLEFPALRFIQKRHDTNRRQLQLRHLLLLALRVLVIALVAFALARPSIRMSASVLGGQKEPVAAVLVFDTSRRMDYRQENRTRLQMAQELGRWLLSQLPEESEVAVLDSRLAGSAFQVDLGAAKDRIERLETAASAQPLPSMLDEALRLLGTSQHARKEIYVFTDLARAAWPSDGAERLQNRFKTAPEAGVYVIDVGISEPTNLALGDLRLSRQVLSNRGTLRINTELTSKGISGDRTVELYVIPPEAASGAAGPRKPVKRGEKTVNVQAGQSQPIEFTLGEMGLGTYQGYLQILGEDNLAADDRRFFTVQVRPAGKVLVVAARPTRSWSYSTPLTQAIAPDLFRKTGQAQYDCTVIAPEELAAQKLESYGVVCLLDPKPMEPTVWQNLGNYVATGHGLAIFLGRNAESDVEALNKAPAQDLLPGELKRQVRSPDQRLYLAPRDLEHPILADFRGLAAVPWFRLPVYRYWQLGTLHEGTHVVAPYTDDGAAILERPLGKGKVVTMTTPVSDDPNRSPWNLMTLRLQEAWPFVILMNDVVGYLVGSGGQELNYVPGQEAVLELDPQQSFNTFVLTGPDGAGMPLTRDPKSNTLNVASTEQPGNYRVRAGGSAGGVDLGFSVNLPADQTRLDRISEEDLKKIFGPIPNRVAQSKDQIEFSVATGRVGRELFPFLILAVAVFLAMEGLVANRFYKE